MNNGLGINFLRFVCEESAASWSQVFARVPFDETEIKQKGSLFGVVKSSEMENWADMEVELTNWVEEYFNGVEVGGDLAEFYDKFSVKYPFIESVWVWIVLENGIRKLKTISSGNGKLKIIRGGEEINLSENLKNKKVIVGQLVDNDEVGVWLGSLGDNMDEWISKEMSEEGSYGAFRIVVGSLSATEPVLVVEEDPVSSQSVEVVEDEEKETPVTIYEKEKLVTDRYVGPVTFGLKIKNWFSQRKRFHVSREIEAEKNKKWPLVLGFVFLGLLVVSLIFGSIHKKGIESEKKWQTFSEPIEKSLAEASGLIKLNPTGGKKIVEDARNNFDAKKGDFGDEKYKERLENLAKKIEETWTSVSGEKNGDVMEVVNLELIRAGVNADRISYITGNKFVVISSGTGLVMSADVSTKEVKVVAGKGAGLGWLDTASDGEKFFVMSKGGVFAVGNESGSLAFDTAVSDPVSMSVFGKNIYILEKGNKEIFKYTLSDTGFGERTRWLKEGQVLSVVPVDMEIDADVWVLGEKGEIEKFRRGIKDNLKFTGLPENMSFEKIAVEGVGKRVALLSKLSGTVVFCDKEGGSCSQQIKSERLKIAKDIVFNADGKLMVLFAGSIGMLN